MQFHTCLQQLWLDTALALPTQPTLTHVMSQKHHLYIYTSSGVVTLVFDPAALLSPTVPGSVRQTNQLYSKIELSEGQKCHKVYLSG